MSLTPQEAIDLLPTWPKWSIPAVVAGVLLVSGLWGWSCIERRHAESAKANATQLKTVAEVHAAQGAVHDQEAAAVQPKIDHDAAEVTRLRAEVARLRAASPRPDPPAPNEPTHPEPVPPPVDLAPLVAKQDELIKAQDQQLQDQALQIHSLTLARDSYRFEAQSRAADAVQLRAALAAQEGVARAERWKGRIEGLAVGLGSGYIAGRLH